MRWVALQVMSADQGQFRSPLSPRNAGASLPLSPFRFPGSHSSGIPLGAPLRRHPVLVDAPWQVLLDLLPLSPNSFIVFFLSVCDLVSCKMPFVALIDCQSC